MVSWRFIASALVLAALAAGCSNAPSVQSSPPCEIIEPGSPAFLAIDDGQFRDWYGRSSAVVGLHSLSAGDRRYLLIVAPAQPTASYRIDLELTGDAERIDVHAHLHHEGPGSDSMPSILARIADGGRKLSYGGITLPEQIQRDSGRYVRHSGSRIEIRISGVPDTIPPREFSIAGEILTHVDELGLTPGDEIRFDYAIREGQPVIVELCRMN